MNRFRLAEMRKSTPVQTSQLPSLILTEICRPASLLSTLRRRWKRSDEQPEQAPSGAVFTTDDVNDAAAQMHRLFGTTELLSAILGQVESPADLACCARVCQLWFQEAVPILWRGDTRKTGPWRSPDVEFLVQFARLDATRLSYYLSWVKHLVLCQRVTNEARARCNGDTLFRPAIWRGFSGRLINLDLSSIDVEERHIRLLLNDKLEELYLTRARYSDRLLSELSTKSPRLAELALGDEDSSVIPLDELLLFLEQSQVRDLSLKRGYQNAIGASHLTKIFSLPQVERLFLDDVLLSSTAFRNTSIMSPLQLTQLTLRVDDSNPLRHILTYMPALKHLAIEFSGCKGDINHDVIDPIISTCPETRLVRLSGSGLPLDGHRLLQVAHACPKMETFMIFPHSWTRSSHSIGADQVLSATSRWPNLRNLFLHQPLLGFNVDALMAIGQFCPRLKLLGLYSHLTSDDFEKIHRLAGFEPNVFPQLKVLDIGFRLTPRIPDTQSFLVRTEDVHTFGRFATLGHDGAPAPRTLPLNTGSNMSCSRRVGSVATHLDAINVSKSHRYTLTTVGIVAVAARIESLLLRIMPNLIMLSHNYNHTTEYAGEWEEDAHDRVADEISKNFEERFPSLICEKGWCECWRAGLE